jgi:hypothetical protein
MSMVHNILQYLTSGVKKAGIKVLSTFMDAAFSMCYHAMLIPLIWGSNQRAIKMRCREQ